MTPTTYLTREIEGANEDLARFAKNLTADPVYAVRSASEVFTAAARHHVASTILAHMQKGASLAEVVKMAEFETLHRARFVPNSTSPSVVRIELEVTAAWADFAHEAPVRWGVDYVEEQS